MNRPDLKETIIAVLAAALVSTFKIGLLHVFLFVDFGIDLHLEEWPEFLVLLTYLLMKIFT